MKVNEEFGGVTGVNPEEAGRRRRRSGGDYSLGEVISGLGSRDWRILIDLYLCRVMPQSAAIEYYFLDSPEMFYEGYATAEPLKKREFEERNRVRALKKARRKLRDLKSGGLVESTNVIPDEMDKPPSRRGRIVGETWYYLTARGLRVVETKIEVLEESKISKLELDMERAKKEHFWELGKVYLDLRYKTVLADPNVKQFQDWDWHPSLTVYSDNKTHEIRPDAVLRIIDDVFYIELDRSTEPVQRSPFFTEQVSIENKLQRYREVLRLTSNKVKRQGTIAFIVPDAIYKTRLENIRLAAERVFPNQEHRVIVGRNIVEIIGGDE